jgi:hypothetical protein
MQGEFSHAHPLLCFKFCFTLFLLASSLLSKKEIMFRSHQYVTRLRPSLSSSENHVLFLTPSSEDPSSCFHQTYTKIRYRPRFMLLPRTFPRTRNWLATAAISICADSLGRRPVSAADVHVERRLTPWSMYTSRVL